MAFLNQFRPCLPFLGLCIGSLAVILVGLVAPGFAFSQTKAVGAVAVEERTRLSQWLRHKEQLPRFNASYRQGLTVLSQQEAHLQAIERAKLLSFLRERSLLASADPMGSLRLHRLIESLPHLGRLALHSFDPYWLEFNPAHDPWLEKGDAVLFASVPNQVAVITASGDVCLMNHAQRAWVAEYVAACGVRPHWLPAIVSSSLSRATPVWLIQPNGSVLKVDSDVWQEWDQPRPEPGAWIWVPGEGGNFPTDFSRDLASLLASQGPVSTELATRLGAQRFTDAERDERAKNFKHASKPQISANDWGTPGYWQMPSARISEGELRFTHSRAEPYQRYSVLMSPLPWFELGFRYIRRMDPLTGDYPGQNLDKNVDAKFRLLQEGAYMPEVSIGLLDGGGTGLFTSEYLVATKRFGNFDISAGAAFGYLAGSSGMRNPLSALSAKFETRQASAVGVGGKPSPSSWFTGHMSPFLGVQWQSPLRGLLVKAEYDSNDYRREPGFSEPLRQRSPINLGVSYFLDDWVELSLALERGDKIQMGVSLTLDASRPPVKKILDDPIERIAAGISSGSAASVKAELRVSPSPERSGLIAQQLSDITLWGVKDVAVSETTAHITLVSAEGYFDERLGRANQFLNLALPPGVQKIHYRVMPLGLPIREVVVDRLALSESIVQYRSERKERLQPVVSESIAPLPVEAASKAGVGEWTPSNISFVPGLSYGQVLGTPEAFYMYHLSASARLKWQLRDDLRLEGRALYRLSDNLDSMRGPGGSMALPLVRTNGKSYFQEEGPLLSNLQLTKTGPVSVFGPNHYYAAYGGYLERMFGGVGAEYLYRPSRGRFAYGLDWNYVGQRNFDQLWGFQDYRTSTGHATVYWDTGYKGVQVSTMFGKYLAKDVGATLTLGRTFANGATMGLWATKTNVSAEEFGEGSFDKGIFFSFPFDAFLPKTTNLDASFVWRPTTRDGGAVLSRSSKLYKSTSQGRSSLSSGSEPYFGIQ